MAGSDDILALLDSVEAARVKCPTCGRSDDLTWIRWEMRTEDVRATIGGGLVSGDGDYDWWDERDPKLAALGFIVPPGTLLGCGNFKDHPGYDPDDKKSRPWILFLVDATVDYEPKAHDEIREIDWQASKEPA